MAQRPVETDFKLAVLHSSLPRCAVQFIWPPIHSWLSLFWCFTFTWSSETLNCLRREKFKHWFLLYFFLFLCSRDKTPWGNCLSTSGANQEQMDGVMTPPGRREQRCNCHSKSPCVDVCKCRFLCRRTTGGYVMALRVLQQTGSLWYEWLTLRQHLLHGKHSIPHSHFSTNDLPD